MQETLFNAFLQAQTSSKNIVNTTTSNTQQQQNTMTNNISLNNISQNGIVLSTTDSRTSGGISSVYPLSTFSSETKSNDRDNNKEKEQTDGISTSQAQQNWLSETMHIIPTLDPSSYMGQYSPTYTSKSFDDLHQFIGKDCPPSDSTTTKAVTVNNSHNSDLIGPATHAANQMQQQSEQEEKTDQPTISDADVYVLFAEQSAMAVSKHAGYAFPHQADSNQSVPDNTSSNVENQIYSSASFCNNTGTSSQLYHNVSSTEQVNSSTTSPLILNKDDAGTRNGHFEGVKIEDDNSPSSASAATFNATNLQLHSAAVEQSERVNEVSSCRTESVNPSVTGQNGTASGSKFDSDSVLRNIVSGSDRSSSDNGNDSSMSGGGPGSSGSDNASDNSDANSYEGQSSSNRRRKGKRRNDIRIKEEEDQDKKRQKTCVGVAKESIQ